MVNSTQKNPIVAAFQGEQRKATIILLSSTALLVTWMYFGTKEFYIKHFSDYPRLFGDLETMAAAFHFLSCFVLLMLIPVLIVKFIFKQRLAEFGFQIGIPKITSRQIFIIGPMFILVGYIASVSAGISEVYPINRHASLSPSILIFHILTLAIFYIAFEFHFRGYLQFGLSKSMGTTNALLVQVLASVLVHFGKPSSEVYASIFAGIFWGILAYRSKSIYGCFAQHFILGVATDMFISYW